MFPFIWVCVCFYLIAFQLNFRLECTLSDVVEENVLTVVF